MSKQKIRVKPNAGVRNNESSKLIEKYKFHYKPEEWERDFRTFLRKQYLPLCFKNPGSKEAQKFINEMTSNTYIDIWIAQVTDPTYNPNVNGNFERTEHYGDRGQGEKLSYLSYVKYPDFTEDDVSNVQSRYLSKMQQAQWSAEIGLPKYYRGFLEMTIDLQEDLFEALYGAILIVGNQVNQGLGHTLAQNFIFYLFKDIKLDQTLKDPKTRFKDIMETMLWTDGPNFKENYSAIPRGNKQVQYVLYLPDVAVSAINKNKKPSKKPINAKIVEKIANIKADNKEILKQMYTEALDILKDYGYDREEILKARKNVQVDDELQAELDEKLAEEKLTNLQVKTFKHKVEKKKTEFIYQLIAHDGEQLVVLYSVKVNFGSRKISREDLYTILIKEFLKHEASYPDPKDRLFHRPIIRNFDIV